MSAVNAIDDEAQSFYEHYLPGTNRERRLVMKVSTAAKALGERWREKTLPPKSVLHKGVDR